jgi:DNA-binding CsgD family transcriptional regulator
MNVIGKPAVGAPLGLIVIIAVQILCAAFFVTDVLADYWASGPYTDIPIHIALETAATLSLLAAIVIETRLLMRLLRRKAHLEHNLAVASAAMHDVIAAHFEDWRLSPSETDVATFLVKGLSIQDIARLRGCAEGTVKAHLNAIYRKSETQNRGDLLSVLLDSVMVTPPPTAPGAPPDKSHTRGG